MLGLTRETSRVCIGQVALARSAITRTYLTLLTYNGSRATANEGAAEYYENATAISRNSIWDARGDGDAWMHTRVQSARTVTRSAWGEVSKCNPGTHCLQPAQENLIVTNSCLYLWLSHHELSPRHRDLVSPRFQRFTCLASLVVFTILMRSVKLVMMLLLLLMTMMKFE